MKVFIDFDGVILNTKKFTLDLEKIYFKNGISKSKILEYKKLISDNSKNKGLTYKLERVIRFLKKGDKKCQERILSSVNIFLKNLKRYVFLDAFIFLKKISQKDLILLSYGDVKFQKDKVFGSGTNKYFSKMIIDTKNKIGLILKTAKKNKISKKEKIFFIDDKFENLEKIERMDRKIITIWLDRYESKNSISKSIEIDYKIRNLREALKIIKNLN